jgi:hypothetical protein
MILAEGNASVTDLLAIARCDRRWSEFWAVRHSNPIVRHRLAIELIEHDALRAANAEKALRQLERKRALNGNTN